MSVCRWNSEGCKTHMHLEQEMFKNTSSPCFMAVGGSLGQELPAQAADSAGGLGGLILVPCLPPSPPLCLTLVLPDPLEAWASACGFCLLPAVTNTNS